MAILRDAASEISYEQYAVVVTASLSGQEVAFGFPTKLTKFASDLKGHLSGWVEQLGLSLTDVLRAFLSRDVFNFLSKVGFNLSKVLKAVNQALSVVKTGLVRTFERIEKEGWLQKLQQGTAKIDELLSHYPLLKKLTGPVVAGLLVYMWFSMSFTGSLTYDMDLSHIVDALAGSYSITDLLATPNGLAQMTLLMTGVLTGGVLSFPWLGASLANFVLALLYTGAKKSNIKNLADKAKQAIQKKATVQANTEIDMGVERVVARLKETAGSLSLSSKDTKVMTDFLIAFRGKGDAYMGKILPKDLPSYSLPNPDLKGGSGGIDDLNLDGLRDLRTSSAVYFDGKAKGWKALAAKATQLVEDLGLKADARSLADAFVAYSKVCDAAADDIRKRSSALVKAAGTLLKQIDWKSLGMPVPTPPTKVDEGYTTTEYKDKIRAVFLGIVFPKTEKKKGQYQYPDRSKPVQLELNVYVRSATNIKGVPKVQLTYPLDNLPSAAQMEADLRPLLAKQQKKLDKLK